MWSLDKGGGVAGRNPATSPAVLAGEGAGKDLGVAHDRLVALVGVGTPSARGAPRCDWFWPLRQGAPARGQPGRPKRGSGASRCPRGGLGGGKCHRERAAGAVDVTASNGSRRFGGWQCRASGAHLSL
jgi:hypothetical protein